jgi:hypothetical protein
VIQHNKKPRWFVVGDKLLWPLVGMGIGAARETRLSSADLQALPYLALCHLAGCLEASMFANEKGRHSVAICLVRQCVEALTVADVGLQAPEYAEPLLQQWKSGKKSHGALRQSLESMVWPRYGTGLWNEPWAEFFRNLARAVQPYAHYTQELQGWQFAVESYAGGTGFVAAIGLETYDPLLATRVTLMHMLVAWTLGRLLLANTVSPDVIAVADEIKELGVRISESKLLFKRGDWRSQLAPHVLFKPGHDWMDD